MNNLEIIDITRATFHSTVFYCETNEKGSRDGFSSIRAQHDSTVACQADSYDIDMAMNDLAAERGLEY